MPNACRDNPQSEDRSADGFDNVPQQQQVDQMIAAREALLGQIRRLRELLASENELLRNRNFKPVKSDDDEAVVPHLVVAGDLDDTAKATAAVDGRT